MRLFIAGICGTFMAGVAQLAKAAGHDVRGCDAAVYPPMSEVLRAQRIGIADGYLPSHLGDDPGTVLIGNALSRGNELVESVLARGLAYQSGPEWLRQAVLAPRAVIAVAGTHGKTTATSMLAWILHCAKASPGYLIGGQPGNFAQSAHLGDGAHFVIEADEYDTAFFDKRSKFVHYRPRIAVLNNLEFDHADIFDDLAQIQRQFHHLVRTVPPNGCIVVNADDAALDAVLAMGCWSEVVRFSIDENSDAQWRARALRDDCSAFEVLHRGAAAARVEWRCIGRHNMHNALAAIAAAAQAGVPAATAGAALGTYIPAARRLQLLSESDAVRLYDDFAHHPTAIRCAIAALRARHPRGRVIAVVELRSNTMRMGHHGAELEAALACADYAIISAAAADAPASGGIVRCDGADAIIAAVQSQLRGDDTIVLMSNGDFGGLADRLAAALAAN